MSVQVFFILAIAAFVGAVLWGATRHLEVFRIAIEDGRPRVVRGKVPPGFLGDVRTIAQGVRSGTIRGVKEGGQARIEASSSIDDRTLQRLRNAFSVYPSARKR